MGPVAGGRVGAAGGREGGGAWAVCYSGKRERGWGSAAKRRRGGRSKARNLYNAQPIQLSLSFSPFPNSTQHSPQSHPPLVLSDKDVYLRREECPA